MVRDKDTLKPYATLKQFKKQGVTIHSDSRVKQSELSDDQKASLFKFKGKYGDEYWLGLKNFYVITRYNHSKLYAMAVFQLSEKLKEK